MVRAVFFDLDDTLVATSEHDKRAFAAVVERAVEAEPAVDGSALVGAFKARFGRVPWDPEYQVEVAEWRAGLWAQALAEVSGKAEQEVRATGLHAELQGVFDETRLGDFPWIEGVPEMVAGLRDRGLRMVVITNGHHKVQRDKLAAVGAGELFEHIIVGGEEVLAGRPEKPAASIFERALGMVGVDAADAIHVGDSLGSDVQGAINAGLRAGVWVDVKRAGAAPPGGPQPHFTVDVVTQLPEVLDRIATEAAPKP